MSLSKYEIYNQIIFEKLSVYLNFNATNITQDMIDAITKDSGLDTLSAYKLLLAGELGFDIVDNNQDKEIFRLYFNKMVKQLNPADYTNNAYYQNIKFDNIASGKIKFCNQRYLPYEAFVYDDIMTEFDGKQIPPIGFFDTEFNYPAILEEGLLWMSVTPNEVETMKDDIAKAHGDVLTFGLGLGYYQYMVSNKPDVKSVTIVDNNPTIIELFKTHILPQFEHKNKIKLVCADGLKYAQDNYPKDKFDFIYVDIWRDVGDGLPFYLKFKKLEKLSNKAEFAYWIEKSMRCYLKQK